MNFIDIAKKRFSCRSYSDKPIEKEKIEAIIEAARIAPSASNKQPWMFYVISEDKNLLSKVHKTYHREWFNNAPVVIIAYADKGNAWVRSSDKKNHSDIDVAIAIDHMTLAATDLGLATCWICNFYVDKVKALFNLSDNFEPVALIPVAYCNNDADINRFDTKRKKMEQIAKFL